MKEFKILNLNLFFGLLLGLNASASIFFGLQIGELKSTIVSLKSSQTRPATSPINRSPQHELDISKIPAPLAGEELTYGAPGATTSLVSYMDYDCPFCAKFYPIAKRVVDNSHGSVNLIFRVYPLKIHPNADFMGRVGFCVAELAGSKGYYSYSDTVYGGGLKAANEPKEYIAIVAKQLNLSQPKLERCLASDSVRNKLDSQVKAVETLGIAGTPTTVVFNNSTHKSALVFGARSEKELADSIIKVAS